MVFLVTMPCFNLFIFEARARSNKNFLITELEAAFHICKALHCIENRLYLNRICTALLQSKTLKMENIACVPCLDRLGSCIFLLFNNNRFHFQTTGCFVVARGTPSYSTAFFVQVSFILLELCQRFDFSERTKSYKVCKTAIGQYTDEIAKHTLS